MKFVDVDGNRVRSDLDARVVGVDAETFLAIPRRLGVAGGSGKFEAIRAMLRGGWINVLITDEATALRLVNQTDE